MLFAVFQMFVDTIVINKIQIFKSDTESVVTFWQCVFLSSEEFKHTITVMKELLELWPLQVYKFDGNLMDTHSGRG